MPGSIKIDDGSGNYTILTNAGSLGSDKTITIPNETATLATTTASNLGGLVKLSSGTASNSADLTFDNFADDTLYTSYKVIFENVLAATDNVELRCTFRNSTPADITATYYLSKAYAFMSTTGSAVVPNNNFANYVSLAYGIGNLIPESFSGEAKLFFPDGTNGSAKMELSFLVKEYTGNLQNYYTTGTMVDTQTALKGLKFYFSSGNITSGSIHIYGVKK